MYRDLIALRKRGVVGGGETQVAYRDGVITLLRSGALLAVFNVSDRDQDVPFPENAGSHWRIVMSTDDVKYGGTGRVAAAVHAAAAETVPAGADQSATFGEQWNGEAHAPRTSHRAPPWTAAVYTVESR
jgi:1,4-alpha-glucan branching enzyme